jgi:hypothetical protein
MRFAAALAMLWLETVTAKVFATTPHCSKSVTATLCWAKADALERDSVKAFLRQYQTGRCDM